VQGTDAPKMSELRLAEPPNEAIPRAHTAHFDKKIKQEDVANLLHQVTTKPRGEKLDF
jgi:hypothetical protein